MMDDTETAPADPLALFASWMDEAAGTEINDPNAMTLATCTRDGRPSARIVLLKAADADGFVFYTNTTSRKGGELLANPDVALLFHWKTLARQVRVEGVATRVAEDEADRYFASRPRISQLGAWASEQSQPLSARAVLERRLAETEARFEGEAVLRPPHWSGFRVWPRSFEFWQDRPFRLHDRQIFERDESSGGGREAWRIHRLYP